MTPEEMTRIADELEKLHAAHKTPGTLQFVIRPLRREYPYLYLINDWDKVRSYPECWETLLQIPHARKFFWELRDVAIRFGWEDKVKEYELLLKPYFDTEDQDRNLL